MKSDASEIASVRLDGPSRYEARLAACFIPRKDEITSIYDKKIAISDRYWYYWQLIRDNDLDLAGTAFCASVCARILNEGILAVARMRGATMTVILFPTRCVPRVRGAYSSQRG